MADWVIFIIFSFFAIMGAGGFGVMIGSLIAMRSRKAKDEKEKTMILTEKQAHLLITVLHDSVRISAYFSLSIQDRLKLLNEIDHQQPETKIQLHEGVLTDHHEG